MNDQLILLDHTNDGFCSSMNSDDHWKIPFESIRNSSIAFLSTEDMETCLYVTNINWHERFRIHLTNDQIQRINSTSSQENLIKDSINSSSKNSHWNYSERSLSTLYRNNNENKNSLRSSSVAYSRLKHFAARLLQLERTVYDAIRQKISDQQISSNAIHKRIPSSLTNKFQRRRSAITNGELPFWNVNNHSSHIPISPSTKNTSWTKTSLPRVHSYPPLYLPQINCMSSSEIFALESPLSPSSINSSVFNTRRHSTTPATGDNSNVENSLEKPMAFEIKTSILNKKMEIKTRQEDTICRIKKASPILTSLTTTQPSSPHRIHIHPPVKSPISNNCLQSIRVSVSASPYENEIIQKIETQSTAYPLSGSNFVKENLDKQTTTNRRPLLALINEVNRQNSSSPSKNLPNDRQEPPLSLSNIVPAKQLTPFRPVILHKKFQEPIGRFDLPSNLQESSSSSPPFPRRNGVMRSHTIPNPTDMNSNFPPRSSNDPITCLSTPQLTSSDQSLPSPALTTQHNSSLSISATSLTSTFNTNVTPTSNVTFDDKNEAKRKAIALQMYDTEKSYVEALKNLVTKYYLPMKDKDIVSNDLINDIFYKIPEIHIHHTAFLISLSQKLSQWDNKQTVGDLLLQMFTRVSVIETYTSFVNNYKTAQIAIRLCRDFSSFNKFLEQQARDHRGKLTLRDLIIQPVQRIPRYELYLKDFLKCTNINHPDYQLMLKAQMEIHSLAEQIDQVQKEVGSTELTLTENSLEVVQDMIENLTDLVKADRYYICHDLVTLQSSSGLKKDRCIFLFNDLIIITSYKRRNLNATKKTNNSVVVNTPSGKQYIDNAKHKLIMKISLESVDLAADHLKKPGSTPPSLKKSPSTTSSTLDKHQHLEEDVMILGKMCDLARTITIPHQQLDDSIKETLQTVNKHLLDETTTNLRRASPEPNLMSDNPQQKTNNIQLILHTAECTETIDVIFSSFEQKLSWEKNFLETKKILFEIAAGRRNLTFQHVLTLPRNRPGSRFSCGAVRSYSNDLCLCNSEGEICLVNIQSNVAVKSSNAITSSRINCIAYIPSTEVHQKPNSTKVDHNQQKHGFLSKQPSNVSERTTSMDSLVDMDSSDEENFSLNDSSINIFEEQFSHEEQNNRDATIWLGTENGGLFVYECSQTMKSIGRKNRTVKQFNFSIHSILYSNNQVFLALNHGQLAVFQRDTNGRWDFDSPIIRSIEENTEISNHRHGGLYDEENHDPISVMTFAAGKLWCAIRDRIFVLSTDTFNVQHSFIADDCHRHVCSMVTGGSSMHHVWIASQGSHEIRLYHATYFVCLLETSIRTAVTQRLQVADDIIRAHKLGCLSVSTLHICKETLWIGTSAGVIINFTIPQLIDSLSISGTNKFASNSIQLKGLTFGHAGPVRLILSSDRNGLSSAENESIMKTFIMTIGDGFEDFNTNDETLGKDDALSHLILWQL